MAKQHDKLMTDLHRMIDAQNFKNLEELEKFMDTMIGKQIPSFPDEVLTDEEKAQDLVLDAYELPPEKAEANIEKALKLDPDCIEAYEFMAIHTQVLERALIYIQKAVDIGRRRFGGEYLDKHKGYFWGLHETRTYMRCLLLYADMLKEAGEQKKSIAILEEMLELNPNDNQGVRDQLMLYYIQTHQDEKYLKYAKIFKDDYSAFALFDAALFTFKNKGAGAQATKKLKAAIKHNRYVPALLTRKKPKESLSKYYSPGDKEEAIYYTLFAHHAWHSIPGAIDWLKEVKASL